jgi:hypothetical protein
MGSLETVFAAVVAVLAALAVIGALAFVIVWEGCAIRRTRPTTATAGPRPMPTSGASSGR